MATLTQKAQFVVELSGSADKIGQALDQRDKRAQLLDKLVGSGLDAERDELREVMNFSVKRRDGKGEVHSMDERGQRKSIETEDARSKYESMDRETATKVTLALSKIVAKKEQMQQAKHDDGSPMFTHDDIVAELFTPLVREGLLPENLVIDGDSEVARMLREVMASFKGMLRDQEEERRKAASKMESDYHGAGTKMDMLKGMGAKAGAFVEGQVGALAGKAGLSSEELKRAGALTGKSLAMANSIRNAYSTGKGADRAIKGIKTSKLSDTVGGLAPPDLKLTSAFGKIGEQLTSIDAGTLNPVLLAVQDGLERLGIAADAFIKENGQKVIETLTKFAKLIESNGVTVAGDVVSVLASGIGEGVGLGVGAGGRYTAGVDLDVAVKRAELRAGISDMARGVEQALRDAMLPYDVAASDAVGDQFARAFDDDALVDLVEPALGAEPDTPPQGAAAVAVVADALARSLAAIHGDLKPSGTALGKAFTSGASSEVSRLGGLFKTGAIPDPQGLFMPLVAVARKAATDTFAGEDFRKAIVGDKVVESVKQAAKDSNAAQEQELEEANAELEEFERQLVLVDEGGMEMARQKSIDALIAQVKADQMDLEIVLKVGGLLGGVGGSVTKLGTDSHNTKIGTTIVDQSLGATKTVATKVADSMIPALQAAQLVMKMSVTIVKIHRRRLLTAKFKADVEKAKKAGSMLMPSIENFYSAKVQQQIFASVELALQMVQLAGAICSSVPEPITMAVGKALTAAGAAGESARDLAKTIHDEVSLRKGWKLTLEALNNPKNRRAGLDALRHNATLAVHSVAWAATDGDPMAREIMRSCGVDAQSLADEGTGKDKVIAYLETLLNEDLQFKDREQVKIDWAPKPLELSYAGWFAIKKRAAKANPPLSEDATPEIDSALKALSLQPKMHTLRAHASDHKKDLAAYKLQSKTAKDALAKFKPVAPDRSEHGEMAAVCHSLATLAGKRVDEIEEIERSLV